MDFGGMNINNLLMLGNNPSPQGSPSSYQPGGSMYTGLPMPFSPVDIASSVGQKVRGPSFSGGLNSMPMNRGSARNSPARAYLAAMSAAGTKGANADLRAMLPLQMNYANANAGLNSQINNSMFSRSVGQNGMSLMMQMLSPFLSQLNNEVS